MSAPISNAFIKQYESEVHTAYQRMGSKLTNMTRKKTGITGTSTTFQKVGKGTAGQKSRHGLVPLMNIDHTPIECVLADYYAGDYVDKLDELKTNIDERKVSTEAGAAAMGRKSDDIVVTAFGGTLIATGATGLTTTKINTVYEAFGANDVPDDGERYFAVDPKCWTDLLTITAFSSSDYVGPDKLPYAGGMVAKMWMGFMFFPFSGLADGAGGAADARNLAWHKNALGFAVGADISTDVTWEGTRQAHFIAHSMSQGAVSIDDLGQYRIDAVR